MPLRRDRNLSDGKRHTQEAWDWLDGALYPLGGCTYAGEKQTGWYPDPDTGERVWDESWKYTVAVSRGRVGRLRKVLRQACEVFAQKCIYLSVAGRVEFVARRGHEER
jgi:hypothetical protein